MSKPLSPGAGQTRSGGELTAPGRTGRPVFSGPNPTGIVHDIVCALSAAPAPPGGPEKQAPGPAITDRAGNWPVPFGFCATGPGHRSNQPPDRDRPAPADLVGLSGLSDADTRPIQIQTEAEIPRHCELIDMPDPEIGRDLWEYAASPPMA
ncbi:hypothetical protein B5V46_15265 [Rhodovulum sp. MB263]|nr:hypothetical protein B5V46_15265 [Rhodovulum sp. MB263]